MKHKCKTSVELLRKQSNGSAISSTHTIMQEFQVCPATGADLIAKAKIMLPVYQRITEDTTVNLTLVPSNLME